MGIHTCQSHHFELEEELLAIFATAPICLFLTDGEARIVKANQGLNTLFGVDVESTIGAPCGFAFDCLHHTDHPAGCGFGPHCSSCGVRRAITETFSTGLTQRQVEAQLQCRQGERIVVRIVRFSTSRVTVSGVNRVLVCLEDITKRKKTALALQKSEELFRRTFDQSPIGAAIIDLDHRFVRVNQELCRITGYAADELLGLRFSEITCAEDLDYNLQQAKALAQGRIDQYEMDKRYIRKDGRLVWVRLSVRLIRDSQGRPLYSLPMMVEIDQRKRLEKEQEVQLELFHLLNKNNELPGMVNCLLAFLKTSFRADALAVCLYQGKERPYYKSLGYPPQLIRLVKGPKCCADNSGQGIKKCNQAPLASMRALKVHCREAGYESVLLIPLGSGDNTMGFLQLTHKDKKFFSRQCVALIKRLAGHIAVVLVQRLAEKNLHAKQGELEETNTALQVLIRGRERDLHEQAQEMLVNIHQLILPGIDRLRLGSLNGQQKAQLTLLEDNLKSIASPFARRLSFINSALSPSLIQVADMIKKGHSNKEIAILLGISGNSVETYRKRIRERLQLTNAGVNLRAYLLSME